MSCCHNKSTLSVPMAWSRLSDEQSLLTWVWYVGSKVSPSVGCHGIGTLVFCVCSSPCYENYQTSLAETKCHSTLKPSCLPQEVVRACMTWWRMVPFSGKPVCTLSRFDEIRLALSIITDHPVNSQSCRPLFCRIRRPTPCVMQRGRGVASATVPYLFKDGKLLVDFRPPAS